ncbi:MAG: type II CAAX prenyl endopeptidase Rce1 family protein, partial [Planctomycetaceae bacterium]
VAVIPLILTLMTVTGAVYPAIDLTAGERERGTLEVLVSAPIPRLSVLVAKYVAVLAVALLTASVNLAMMAVTLRLSGLGATLFGGEGLGGASLAAIAALMLLFAGFYSAVLLVVTCTARSFKEAQAYLIPVILLSLSPAVLSLMPGVQLAGLLQLLPPVNLVLLGRDLLTHQVEPRSAAIVVVSTLVYAGLALALAARLFGSEAVLYNTATGWSSLLRRPRGEQSWPSPPLGWTLVALAFPGFFLLQGLAGLAANLVQKLLAGGVTTVIVFVLVPLLVLAWRRIRWTGWYAAPASPWTWLGAGLLGVSLWILDHELIVAVAQLREVDFSQLLPRLEGYATALRQVPLPLLLLLISIVPAVCEEFFFRGVLWSAFAGPQPVVASAPELPADLNATAPGASAPSSSAGSFRAWWITSLVFGLFHLVMPNPLAVERLVGTTAMGFVLGWVRRQSGSVWAGTLLHVLHNGLAVLVSYHADALRQAGLANAQAIDQHFPLGWIAGAVAVATLGLLLAGRSRRTTTPG